MNAFFMPQSAACLVLSVSPAAGSIALPTYGSCLKVINRGAATVFVELGDSDIVATVDESYPVLCSSVAELYRSTDTQTYISAVCAADENSIVNVHAGESK